MVRRPISTDSIPEKLATIDASNPKLKLKLAAEFSFGSFFFFARNNKTSPATKRAGGKCEIKGWNETELIMLLVAGPKGQNLVSKKSEHIGRIFFS